MKRYYALLTLSFLSTSSLLKAGFDPMALMELDFEGREEKVAAKVKRLKINKSTNDQALSRALEEKEEAVKNLLVNPEDAITSYYAAKEITSERRKHLQLPTIRQRVQSLIQEKEILENNINNLRVIFDRESEQEKTIDQADAALYHLASQNIETQQQAALDYLLLQPQLTLISQEAEIIIKSARELLDPLKRKDLKNQKIKLENALISLQEKEKNNMEHEIIERAHWDLSSLISGDDEDTRLRAALMYLRNAPKALAALPSEQEIRAANGRRVFDMMREEAATFFLINAGVKMKTPIENHPLYACLNPDLQRIVKGAVQQGPATFPQNEEDRKVIFRDRDEFFLRYGLFPDQDSFFYGIQIPRRDFLDQLLEAGTKGRNPKLIRNIFKHEIRLKKYGFDEIDSEDLRENVSEEEFREYVTTFYAGGSVPLEFVDAYGSFSNNEINLWTFSVDQKEIFPIDDSRWGLHLGLSHGYFYRLVNHNNKQEIAVARAIEERAIKRRDNPDNPVDLILSRNELRELFGNQLITDEDNSSSGMEDEDEDEDNSSSGMEDEDEDNSSSGMEDEDNSNSVIGDDGEVNDLDFMTQMDLQRAIYPENPQLREEIVALLSPLPEYQLLAHLEEDREAPRYIKQYIAQAQKDNVEALYRLAEVYQKGNKGILKNSQKARDLYKEAAYKFGSAKALCQLAEMYENSDDVEQNIPLAIALYEKAAERGGGFYGEKTNAMARLFEMYEDKEGVEQRPDIICKLAYAFLTGEMGLWRDQEKAFELFDQAAAKAVENRDVAALHKLEEIYTMLKSFEKAENCKRAATAPRLKSIPLKKASQSRADLSKNDGIMTVTTDNSQKWMYQVETDRFPIKPGDLLRVSYDITADEEEMITLDLLNSRKAWFFGASKRIVLTNGRQTGTIEFVIPEGESEASLVFYNNRTSSTPTQLTIHNLAIESHSEPEVPAPRLASVPLKKGSHARTAANSALNENDGIMTVTTDNSQKWMHQAETDRFPVKPGDILQVNYNINATEGGMIAFDLLNTKKAWFSKGSKRVVLKKGDQTGIIEYEVPEGESEASLVFYNDKASLTPTQLMIHSLRILKEEVKK